MHIHARDTGEESNREGAEIIHQIRSWVPRNNLSILGQSVLLCFGHQLCCLYIHIEEMNGKQEDRNSKKRDQNWGWGQERTELYRSHS